MTKVFVPTNRTGRIGMAGLVILLILGLTGCTGRGGGVLRGCRFTAGVRDTGERGPSKGDYLSIKLFGGPDTGDVMHTVLPIYARDGYLESGNFQVDNS